jgi:hypothetical protein
MGFEELQPERQDRAITDYDEQALFAFQISQKIMQEKQQGGTFSHKDQRMFEVINRTVDLMQQIIDERDTDKKTDLRDKLHKLQADSEETERLWMLADDDDEKDDENEEFGYSGLKERTWNVPTLDEIKPGLMIEIESTVSGKGIMEVLDAPFQDGSGKWRVSVNDSGDKTIKYLSDMGIVPYENGGWNDINHPAKWYRKES